MNTSVLPSVAERGRFMPTGATRRSLLAMGSRKRVERAWDVDRLPEGADKASAVRAMFDAIAPRYDLVNRIMTFRLDVVWRRIAVRSLGLPEGSLVADLASGTGDLCRELARQRYTALSFDFSLGMLRGDTSGAPRTQADILHLPLADTSVDAVTCGFALRNVVDLGQFFGELSRVVRPGGRIALLDVGIPRNRFVRWGNSVYFGKVVPRIGALLSDGPAYSYLPRSVAYLPPASDMVAMLTASGFDSVRHRQLSGGLTQLLSATRHG
jgi:demethylmenaquinone methyltransferase/2-methoxy-6-polyprenyl-1,4-benzoquinol methylase